MRRRAAGGAGGSPERGLFDGPAPAPAGRGQPSAADGPEAPAQPRLYRVGELTRVIAERIGAIGRVRVEGEVSQCRRHASGHVYFTLKDDGARLDCVIWRSVAARALGKLRLEEGVQVVAHGHLDVYPPKGGYSLVVDTLEPLGIGALLAQLERLKGELRARGWFDRRRPLPRLPRVVGVVTSRDGAALRDVLRTRSLRWPGYPLRLCHTPVQGPGAAAEIADAIRRTAASGVDVLVVCRGGGSLEDLWCFNELVVAEAIWESGVPVVTGVGHETDTTLADLVADHRAHTPTDAAQTVIPDRAALVQALERQANWLETAMGEVLAERSERLERCVRHRLLHDAEWILGERERALARLQARGTHAVRARLRAAAGRASAAHARLERQSPRAQLERWRRRVGDAAHRLEARVARRVDGAAGRLAELARTLEATSPLKVLARGYSVTVRRGDGEALTDAARARPGDELETRLAKGRLVSRVESVEPDGAGPA